MGFMIGQSVIHPAHGAGKIVGIQEEELVKGYQSYYVIEFARNRLTVHVPVRRVDDIGVRPIMSAGRISGVMAILESLPIDLPDEFRLRRAAVDKQIHSGYPKQIAAAVRDLTWRNAVKYLTEADKEALSEARMLLITETALALDQENEQTEESVDAALVRAVEARQAAEEREEAEREAALADWSFQPPVAADLSETPQ